MPQVDQKKKVKLNEEWNTQATDQFRLAVLHDSVYSTLANVRNFWVEGEESIPCFFYGDILLLREDVHDHLFMFIREFFLAAGGGFALDAMFLLEHLNH